MFFTLELVVVTRLLVSRANARDLATHPAQEAATILSAAVALTKFRGGGFRRTAVVTVLGAIAAGGLAWALPDSTLLDVPVRVRVALLVALAGVGGIAWYRRYLNRELAELLVYARARPGPPPLSITTLAAARW